MDLDTSLAPYDPDQDIPDESHSFFQAVRRMADLYVTFRQKFVLMNAASDGSCRMYVPKCANGSFVKLTDKLLCGHLNQRFAISVYSGPSSAKFMCFDVDDGSVQTVRDIVSCLDGMGIPSDYVEVSTSGGKGYHVEIFFDGLVYISQIRKVYYYVVQQLNLDVAKVEFRPSPTNAIKLPLSKHFRTGNTCWYLDKGTMAPIQTREHLFDIRQFSCKAFAEIAQSLAVEIPSKGHSVGSAVCEAPLLEDGDEYPDLTEAGHRFLTMRSIAIYERNKGNLSEDNLRARLAAWVARQKPEYITDTPKVIQKDIDHLVDWVFNPKFHMAGKRLKSTVLRREDVALCLAQKTKVARRIMFVLVCYARRYGAAKLSMQTISDCAGCVKARSELLIADMVGSGYLSYKRGRKIMQGSRYVMNVNVYTPLVGVVSPDSFTFKCDELDLGETFSHEKNWFVNLYYKTMAEMVDKKTLASILSKSEMKEIEQYVE